MRIAAWKLLLLAVTLAGISAPAWTQSLSSIEAMTLGLPAPQPNGAVLPSLTALGRKLFHDKRLSRDGTISCATCHDPQYAFTDGLTVSRGVGREFGTRNAPSLLNVGYATSLFWDGRRATLEEQVADPFTNAREHGLASGDDLVARVMVRKEYRELLARAFPGDVGAPQPSQLFVALAAYLRTLRVGGSPFDRYNYAGDRAALDEHARRGLELFRGRAGCSECHTMGVQGALFTDNKYHGIHVGTGKVVSKLPELTRRVRDLSPAEVAALVAADPEISALGRFLVTKDPRDIGKYRTPSLRNVALTAPYMHDGSLATLREAVDHEIYYRSRQQGPSPAITLVERDELVAFLNALTSTCLIQEACPGM